MSLKAFHILFISLSIVITVLFGIWCAQSYADTGKALYLVGTVFAFVFSASLLFYGIWFLKKIRALDQQKPQS